METYYIVCWVDGERVVRCGHEHGTIREAESCRPEILGRFIRAVGSEGERSINDEEVAVWRTLEKRIWVRA